MQKISCFTFLFLLVLSSESIGQDVRFSTKWFGPNANPVPEFTDATIPSKTEISVMSDVYFGYGDFTTNERIKVEVPFFANHFSFGFWTTEAEFYFVDPQLALKRHMDSAKPGYARGDYYVQTRFRILQQSRHKIDMILNSTLKTASGTDVLNRRYFDSPGYYFDCEIGKSIYLPHVFFNELRFTTDLGFFSWQAGDVSQDDALMFGLKISLMNEYFTWTNTFSGYWGWMHTHPSYGPEYGDQPLVLSTKLTHAFNRISLFGQYQAGLRDFPYHQVRFGITMRAGRMTPQYAKWDEEPTVDEKLTEKRNKKNTSVQ
ncbi:MAG: hypothetical protein IPH66_09060 [Crocinitomicaceae bacterium]|nr:hypothetical protein [Crocinitomicaceae bacterium]